MESRDRRQTAARASRQAPGEEKDEKRGSKEANVSKAAVEATPISKIEAALTNGLKKGWDPCSDRNREACVGWR